MTKSTNKKKLSIWGFLLLVIIYLAIIKGVGFLIKDHVVLVDGKLGSVRDIIISMWLPLGLAFVFVYGTADLLGWLKPVFHETKRVQKWVWVVPVIFAVAILLGINYSGLIDSGLGFTVALLIACMFVGFGEEGMFRGIGVTTLRQYNITEGKVALWSSVIFGAVHLSNLIGGNPKAFIQAAAVSFAGYFFYLIRRVSGSNILNSVLHGLFDFTILTGTGIIVVKDKPYIGSGTALLVYILVGIILLIRRHKIELKED